MEDKPGSAHADLSVGLLSISGCIGTSTLMYCTIVGADSESTSFVVLSFLACFLSGLFGVVVLQEPAAPKIRVALPKVPVAFNNEHKPAVAELKGLFCTLPFVVIMALSCVIGPIGLSIESYDNGSWYVGDDHILFIVIGCLLWGLLFIAGTLSVLSRIIKAIQKL